MSSHKTRASSKNRSKTKNKTKSEKSSRYIYYTGLGAKKSGKHTKKEFLTIMSKTFHETCPLSMAEKNYKPCKTYQNMEGKMMRYAMKHNKPAMWFNNRTCKSHNKYKREMNKCAKYVEHNKCNLDDYLKYTGAVYE